MHIYEVQLGHQTAKVTWSDVDDCSDEFKETVWITQGGATAIVRAESFPAAIARAKAVVIEAGGFDQLKSPNGSETSLFRVLVDRNRQTAPLAWSIVYTSHSDDLT